jgi:hypothetical protein
MKDKISVKKKKESYVKAEEDDKRTSNVMKVLLAEDTGDKE